MLHSFRSAAGPLAIISFLGLLWSGSALFGAIEDALAALVPAPRRGFVRRRLVVMGMIVVFTALVVPATASSSVLSLLDSFAGAPSVLVSGPVPVLLQIAFGILDGAALFCAIYWLVPNRRVRPGAVIPGALVAATLFEAFQLLFPLYFRLEHGFGTYGATFALFFLLMTFAFWVAQITVIGAAINAELHPPVTGDAPGARTPPA